MSESTHVNVTCPQCKRKAQIKATLVAKIVRCPNKACAARLKLAVVDGMPELLVADSKAPISISDRYDNEIAELKNEIDRVLRWLIVGAIALMVVVGLGLWLLSGSGIVASIWLCTASVLLMAIRWWQLRAAHPISSGAWSRALRAKDRAWDQGDSRFVDDEILGEVSSLMHDARQFHDRWMFWTAKELIRSAGRLKQE